MRYQVLNFFFFSCYSKGTSFWIKKCSGIAQRLLCIQAILCSVSLLVLHENSYVAKIPRFLACQPNKNSVCIINCQQYIFGHETSSYSFFQQNMGQCSWSFGFVMILHTKTIVHVLVTIGRELITVRKEKLLGF